MTSGHNNSLQVEPRTITGKQVKQLRQKGLVPGSIATRQGTKLIQFPLHGNERILSHAGIISLEISNQGSQQVLIKEIARAPINKAVIHVDFEAVTADHKITTEVPIMFLGEAPAEKEYGGIVMRQMETLHVTCLPAHLPEMIPVELGAFTELKQTLTVGDLPEMEGVTVLNPPEATIVTIAAPQLETEEALESEAESTAEAPEGAVPEDELKAAQP